MGGEEVHRETGLFGARGVGQLDRPLRGSNGRGLGIGRRISGQGSSGAWGALGGAIGQGSCGGEPKKLAPLLAALKDILPWRHQWHNQIDPEYGDRISTTYQQFYETERHTLRLTDESIEGIRMGAV